MMQTPLFFTNQCAHDRDVHLCLQRWADDGGAVLGEEHVDSDTQKYAVSQSVTPGRNATPIIEVVSLNRKASGRRKTRLSDACPSSRK